MRRFAPGARRRLAASPGHRLYSVVEHCKVDYHEYAARFWEHKVVAEVRTCATLLEGGVPHELLVAQTPGRRSLVITAGFHGDEVAGPLTLLEHLPVIVEHARRREVGLRIYPCLNPSGFTDGTRYNRSGESPNNDFMRYEVEPGRWVGELWSNEPILGFERFRQGPKEPRPLLADLEAAAPPHAALDLHQDPWLEGARSYA